MNHLLALPKYPPKVTMSSSNMADDENRPTADFHPSPWGDFFATHNFASDHVLKEWKEGIEVLKPYVVRMLSATAGEDAADKFALLERLKLVDVVERLGIGYLFEGEIQQILQQVYETHDSTDDLNNDNMNLHDVALRFRLLREHGYDVSSDIFNEFKTKKGEFKEELASDVEGILSLYEASYLRKQGENVLDEAIQFTKSHLEAKVVDVESLLSERLAHALERPLRKGMEILEHLFFISIYERMSGHHATLLRLAKLSFNVLQNMYQGELRALTEYWIDLDFARRLHYGRDKLVEAYIWGVGSLWEPKFALARTSITKIAALGTFLDDTYDAYGTIEELELLTTAIERWDPGMEKLNAKMRFLFEAIAAFYDEIDTITSKEGRPYCSEYGKMALRYVVRLYLTEVRGRGKAKLQTFEEYRKVSSQSTCYVWMVCAALFGYGELAPKNVFDWLFAEPKILLASSDHCRLMDDIVTHQFERERGHIVSSVECYMMQYGVSREEAVNVLKEMVEEDWKIVNQELLHPSPCKITHVVPHKDVLSIFLGFEKVMDVLYKYSDAYTNSTDGTKDMLTALLVTPLPISP